MKAKSTYYVVKNYHTNEDNVSELIRFFSKNNLGLDRALRTNIGSVPAYSVDINSSLMKCEFF